MWMAVENTVVRFRLLWDDNDGNINPPRLWGICESLYYKFKEATDKRRATVLIYFNVTTLEG